MPTTSMVQIALNFTLPNTLGASVIRHALFGAAPTIGQLTLLANQIDQWWDAAEAGVPAAKTYFNDATTLDNITITQLAGVPPLEYVENVGTAGSALTDAPPNESAIVNTWYTGFPGRSFRGRSYWSGYDLAFLSPTGLIDGASLALWTTSLERLNDDINTANGGAQQHCVYSRTLDVMTPITSLVVRDVLHHQSRRNT